MNICFPTTIPAAAQPTFDAINSLLTESSAGAYVNDINIASKAIKISVLMGLVYSLLFIYFMSAFGEPLAWFCVILIQLALLAATGVFYMLYDGEVKNAA